MRKVPYLLFLVALSLPVAASESGLYKELENAAFMKTSFISKRSPTGIDFESKERISLHGQSHPKFHIEIEGPLPVPGVTSLEFAVEKIAAVVAPEVDQTHHQENSIYPGLRLEVVDINGINVAFLKYKNLREPNTFNRRAVIYTDGGVYIATISLHSVPENHNMGMTLEMLVVAMINSNEFNRVPKKISRN